jgi:hypothetical protein
MNMAAVEPTTDARKHGRSKAAAAAAAGLTGLALFEVALALGAPLGRAAFGGTSADLPPSLRIISAIAVLLWLSAALVVLRRGGYPALLVSDRAARVGTWALTAVLSLGVLLNLASPSPWERYLLAPITASLAVLCLLVARRRTTRPERASL